MTASATAGTTRSDPSPRRWLRPLAVYVLPPAVALALVLVPVFSQFAVLPRLRVSPGFALIDQTGQPLTSEDLRGSIAVYSLATMDCPEACRNGIEALRQVQLDASESWTADEAPPVRFVTILLDPLGDEPEQLARFAQQHGIDLDGWSVVSGSEATIRAVVGGGFEVYVPPDLSEATFEPATFLTDHVGFIRAEYLSHPPEAGTVYGDIERIVDERNAGSVGGLVYGAAHKFNFTCNSP